MKCPYCGRWFVSGYWSHFAKCAAKDQAEADKKKIQRVERERRS